MTDYKTGRDYTRRNLVVGGGEMLQPVLYGLAVEHLLAAPVVQSRLYYCTRAGGFSERVVPLSEEARGRGTEVLALIDRAIEAGFLPAAPRARACRSATSATCAGPHEETRITQKDQAPPRSAARAEGMAVSRARRRRPSGTRIRTSLDETLVVEAAAGTGKTSELVARLVNVLAEGRGTVQTIAALTFTEKAAGELKLRLRAGLEEARERAADGSAARAARGRHRPPRGGARQHDPRLLQRPPARAAGRGARRPGLRGAAGGRRPRRSIAARSTPGWPRRSRRPPEGLRRALRRRSFDGDPIDRLRRAGWQLAGWRDFRAPWQRRPFDRAAAIETLIAPGARARTHGSPPARPPPTRFTRTSGRSDG